MAGNPRLGQGSVIGAAFMLLILMTGFSFYSLHINVTNEYLSIIQEMQQLDLERNQEDIEFSSITFTDLNLLNLTVRNNGPNQAHLIWLGIFDEAANTQNFYPINFFLDPSETVSDIRNDTVPSFEGQERIIQLTTELGNVFRYSYPADDESGWGERYDFVDETSDLYSPSSKGNHSFFSAQKHGPDGICDVIIEASVNKTMIDQESFEDDWPPIGWNENPGDTRWEKEGNEVYDGTYSADFDGHPAGRSGNLDTFDMNCSDADAIYVDFWYRDKGCEGDEFLLQYFNGTAWVNISDLGSTDSEDQWLNYQEKIVDNQFFKSNFKLRWSSINLLNRETAFVDLVTVKKELVPNYELDLEVQWIGVDYSEVNEWLCIYGGEMGSEDLLVDVWNGADWINVFNNLSSGWNSVDVSPYLVSSTFTIRFRGSIETGDVTKDCWEIDATFLHVWAEEG